MTDASHMANKIQSTHALSDTELMSNQLEKTSMHKANPLTQNAITAPRYLFTGRIIFHNIIKPPTDSR